MNQIGEILDCIWKIFRTFNPVLYAIGIDKNKHLSVRGTRTCYDPVAIAYAYLQQRLASLSEHTTIAVEPMLILADEQIEHEHLFRTGQVSDVRKNLQRAMHKAPDINNIIAKPVWIDSEEMEIDREIIQIVDLMLYSVRYGMLEGNWTHPWLVNMGPHFARHWGNGRGIGAVWNAGITMYPRPYYRKIFWANV